MKKTLITLVISVVLALIMPLSVWADFLDSLIDPTLHISTQAGSFNYDKNRRNNPVILDSVNFGVHQKDGGNKFIRDGHFVLLLALLNRTSGIKFQTFMATPYHPFLENRGTSINGSSVSMPSKAIGYSDLSNINGAIQTTMTSKDTTGVIGLGVFIKNSMSFENFTTQPLPDDALNAEVGIVSTGIYAFNLSTRAIINSGSRNFADIIWSHNGLSGGTLIAADGKKDADETKIYFTPFTDFAMVKNVLEPGTMLLLGICALSLGLFAIKLRK